MKLVPIRDLRSPNEVKPRIFDALLEPERVLFDIKDRKRKCYSLSPLNGILQQIDTAKQQMLTNEQVIEEMMNLTRQIADAQKIGKRLGPTADELAFYEALTKPQAIKEGFL